jgi:hypothetical protein
MAAARIAAPGTDAGPCLGECEHTDCAAVRAQAEAPCYICKARVGYDVRYYVTPEGAAHGRCIEEGHMEDERATGERPCYTCGVPSTTVYRGFAFCEEHSRFTADRDCSTRTYPKGGGR